MNRRAEVKRGPSTTSAHFCKFSPSAGLMKEAYLILTSLGHSLIPVVTHINYSFFLPSKGCNPAYLNKDNYRV